MGPRAGRALDRARTPSRRPTSSPTPPTPATTPSCATSSATCSSRSTSSRCCSRSAARATWRRSPSTCARSSSAATRTSSARSRPRRAGEVLRNWDEIKRAEPGREDGIFGEVPENLPALLHARKVQRRARQLGLRLRPRPLRRRRAASSRSSRPPAPSATRAFHEVGDVLFAAVNVARKLQRRPRARAALGERALPRPRRGGRAARRAAGADWDDADARRQADLLRPSEVERMSQIDKVHARQVLDSRGNPTVEVELVLRSGAAGRASCPAAPRPASSRPPSCATAATPTAARA